MATSKVMNNEMEAKKEVESKKVVEKKTTAKRSVAKKDPKTNVVLQIYGYDVSVEELVKRATKEFKKSNKSVEIKSLDVYVNIDERKAYYVVNKEESPDFVLDL